MPREAIGPDDVDSGVVQEVIVLEAAQPERNARRHADRGDYGTAHAVLTNSAEHLRGAAPMSSRTQEVLDQAEAMDASGALMSPTTWSARSSKGPALPLPQDHPPPQAVSAEDRPYACYATAAANWA